MCPFVDGIGIDGHDVYKDLTTGLLGERAYLDEQAEVEASTLYRYRSRCIRTVHGVQKSIGIDFDEAK